MARHCSVLIYVFESQTMQSLAMQHEWMCIFSLEPLAKVNEKCWKMSCPAIVVRTNKL